jgi:nitrate/nitrite-specific signal transduction histidine kinase
LSTNSLELAQSLKLAESEPVFEAVDIGDENRINQVGVAVMEEMPWKVAYFQPQDVYLAPEITLVRRTILLTLLALGVVAGVALTIANFISRPIVQLGQAAGLVAKGDFSVQVVEYGDRETDAMARAFNLMTGQIRDSLANLERRVAERTRALQISNRVSQQLSTILDRQELMRTVVNQVQSAFDYYHVHIYLYDEAGESLHMAAGTGSVGETMLRQGHKISKGQGLVGRAGVLNEAVLMSDVSKAADWLPNPLLPDTKAETAVPIALGNNVLGVLDVQSDQVDGLSEADVDLLRSMSNQIAIALRNSQLYAQTQRQVEHQTRINEINQRILQTTDMQEAMKVALREIGRATGAQQVAIKLGKQRTENGHEIPDQAESEKA